MNRNDVIYAIIYLGLIFIALLLSCISYRLGLKKTIYLVIILTITFIEELSALYNLSKKQDFAWIYCLYNPIEYALLCLYYLNTCPSTRFKFIIQFSIPVFILFSLCVTFFLTGFKGMPSINISVEGILLFVLYTHLLFCLDIPLGRFIYSHPDFWISIGMLIFFGGIFVFLGFYPYLLKINKNVTNNLFADIDRPLNIILYSCIITGLVCSIRNKKYFIS